MNGEAESAIRPARITRDFAVFWSVQGLSELGNGFALVALPLLVLKLTGSVVQMGLLTATAGLASLGTGLIAGALVDHLDRRRMMMLCEAARLVLYGLIPVVWLVSPQLWLLYVVMAATAAFNLIFQTAYVTAIPALVDREQITTANSRLETTNATAYIVGPMLAGAVTGLFGPTTAIAVNAATFGVSWFGLALIRLQPKPASPATAIGWRDMRDGFLSGARFLARHPVLRPLTLLLTIITFMSLGMVDVLIYHVSHDLGGSERLVGYVLGVTGIGTIAGAGLSAWLRRRVGFGWCWLGSYALCGLTVAALGMSTGVVAAAALAFGYSFGMALAGVCSVSLRQQVTPPEILGRVTSAFWTLHSALAPLGAAVLTLAVSHVGVRTPLLVVGAIFLVLVVAGLRTPISQAYPERVPVTAG
ncbi:MULTISPECIES: MFS transporter [Micromonospora]|uniref:MFS transporter n=1 Tax=Micromonospora TaxID=1873 RepID=UPI000A845F87|nr:MULTISPECIES: MFS transporter [Micromonospora]NJC12920.1 MFS family permease [Micromonospora profundi]